MKKYSEMATKSPKTKKTTAKKTENYSEEEVITIELQYLLTPLAILISAFMISASIFISMKNYGGGAPLAATTAGTVAGAGDTIVPSDEPEFVSVQTTIDDDAIIGNVKTAKVAIVEFSDFECPYCQQYWEDTHSDLIEKYVDTGEVIIVYRDLPLDFHPAAQPAAVAANCAREQKGDAGYYSYHDALFAVGLTSVDQLAGFADTVGLNASQFSTCLDSGKYDAEIAADAADAAAAGIGGTPGFVIGVLSDDGTVDGVRIGGAYPLSTFDQIIQEQLDRA